MTGDRLMVARWQWRIASLKADLFTFVGMALVDSLRHGHTTMERARHGLELALAEDCEPLLGLRMHAVAAALDNIELDPERN